jgi:hypothetical protein
MLFQLLKSVKKWVSDFILNNKIADAEVRAYEGFWKDKDASN